MCAKDDGTSKSRSIKNAARSRRKEKKYCNFLFHGDVELHGYLLDADMTRDATADVDIRLLCRNATVRGAKMSTVSVTKAKRVTSGTVELCSSACCQ